MATITAAARRYSGLSVWPESVRGTLFPLVLTLITDRKYKRHFHVPTPAAPSPAPSAGGDAHSGLFPSAQRAAAARRSGRCKA